MTWRTRSATRFTTTLGANMGEYYPGDLEDFLMRLAEHLENGNVSAALDLIYAEMDDLGYDRPA